jgi:hypothetical protein
MRIPIDTNTMPEAFKPLTSIPPAPLAAHAMPASIRTVGGVISTLANLRPMGGSVRVGLIPVGSLRTRYRRQFRMIVADLDTTRPAIHIYIPPQLVVNDGRNLTPYRRLKIDPLAA